MRKRNIRIQVWLSEKEKAKLIKNAKKAGLSRETYIRSLLRGYVPRQAPPVEYYLMMGKLHIISESLVQIAARANAAGHINAEIFKLEADHLRCALIEIQAAVTSPERMKDNGNDSDMGRKRPP